MSNTHQHNKSIIKILCKSLYDFDEQAVRDTLKNLFRDDAVCHYSHPFGDLSRDQLYEGVFAPLAGAFPDVERRDIICIAGADQDGFVTAAQGQSTDCQRGHCGSASGQG